MIDSHIWNHLCECRCTFYMMIWDYSLGFVQWLTLVTSLTVVSTGRTVVQVTNREDTSSSNCPPTASGRLSPLNMLSKHWNKINTKYVYWIDKWIHRWIDRMTDGRTKWFLNIPLLSSFFQGEKESIVKQRNFKIPEGISVWKMCDFESI